MNSIFQNRTFALLLIFSALVVFHSCENSNIKSNITDEIKQPILPQPLHTDIIFINSQQRSSLYRTEQSLLSNAKLIQSEAAIANLNSKATLMLNISSKSQPYADDFERLARAALTNKSSRVKLFGLIATGAVTLYALTEYDKKNIESKSTFNKEFEFSPINNFNTNNIDAILAEPKIGVNLHNELQFHKSEPKTIDFYGVTLKNNSNTTIYAAVKYLDINGKWVTEGWWKIKPGNTSRPDIKATGKYIYYHAHNEEYSLYWGDAIESNVCNFKFKFKGNYSNQNSYLATFYEVDKGDTFNDTTFEFP